MSANSGNNLGERGLSGQPSGQPVRPASPGIDCPGRAPANGGIGAKGQDLPLMCETRKRGQM